MLDSEDECALGSEPDPPLPPAAAPTPQPTPPLKPLTNITYASLTKVGSLPPQLGLGETGWGR